MTKDQFLRSVGGKKIAHGPEGGAHWNFGWVDLLERTPGQMLLHEKAVEKMPAFAIQGRWQLEARRYPLWAAGKKLLGHHLKYNYQQTGSCVGAGGGNMLKTLMCVEIVLGGEHEEYKEIWWPFTYGMSRLRSGMSRPGEGSTGSGWAEAATEDGTFEVEPEGHDTPDFKEQNGWLVIDGRTEVGWSAGPPGDDATWKGLAKKHLIKAAAPMRSADDCIAALANGYPLTQASNFGFKKMAPAPQGDPPVRVASWDGSWSHQTYVDEYWEHPTLGELFRWGNNWGPDAHGSATGEEPNGGVYIKKATMDQICKRGEVYAFSGYAGFPARKVPVDWST
jgi:hypothetical protein